MVDQLVDAAIGAKLEPVGLDLVPFALVRAIGTSDAGMDLEETGDEAVIDIGAHVTNIVVHARGIPRFVRILPSGGRDITNAIARGLEVEDDVAEQLKRGEAVEMEDPPSADDVREIAMQRAQNFVDEVRSSLEFYTAQAQVDQGRVFEHVNSQLSLSAEAVAEAEPVLTVAVGLAIPGRKDL
jgi:type IV pilus assembly protein PilM